MDEAEPFMGSGRYGELNFLFEIEKDIFLLHLLCF